MHLIWLASLLLVIKNRVCFSAAIFFKKFSFYIFWFLFSFLFILMVFFLFLFLFPIWFLCNHSFRSFPSVIFLFGSSLFYFKFLQFCCSFFTFPSISQIPLTVHSPQKKNKNYFHFAIILIIDLSRHEYLILVRDH